MTDPHSLVIEYRSGQYEARCLCGAWWEPTIPLAISQLREIYPRLEARHREHVDSVRAPAGGGPAPHLTGAG